MQIITFSLKDFFPMGSEKTVLVGKLMDGSLSVGNSLSINIKDARFPIVIMGIEQFSKKLSIANAGDEVGLLVSGIRVSDLKKDELIHFEIS